MDNLTAGHVKLKESLITFCELYFYPVKYATKDILKSTNYKYTKTVETVLVLELKERFSDTV